MRASARSVGPLAQLATNSTTPLVNQGARSADGFGFPADRCAPRERGRHPDGRRHRRWLRPERRRQPVREG